MDNLTWRKSSASATNGACVEFALLPSGRIAVRNSRDPQGGMLAFTRGEISAMLAGAKGGEFDDLG